MSDIYSSDIAIRLGLFSAALVARRDDLVRDIIIQLHEEGIPRKLIYEIILQSYLHDGYATALEGVALLSEIWPMDEEEELEGYQKWEEWERRGIELFRTIYGKVADKVEASVKSNSPEMALWMVREGYGKVLSRPGADICTRELCTVAVLVMKNRPRQLHSHLRGALRVGVSLDVLHNLLDLITDHINVTDEVIIARNLLKTIAKEGL